MILPAALAKTTQGAPEDPFLGTYEQFSKAFDEQLSHYQNGPLADYCCDPLDRLPPVRAILGGTIRAGYEQLKYSIWRNTQIVFRNVPPDQIPYRRYFLQEDEWGKQYAIAYKEYATEPSTTVRLTDNTLAGLDLSVIVPVSGTVGTMMAKTPNLFVSDLIKNITRNFGNLACFECAAQVVKNLQKQGISGEVITLEANTTRRGFIFSQTANKVISQNGRHRAVLVEGMVYDNIHKSGIPFEKWLRDFEVLGGFKKLKKVKF